MASSRTNKIAAGLIVGSTIAAIAGLSLKSGYQGRIEGGLEVAGTMSGAAVHIAGGLITIATDGSARYTTLEATTLSGYTLNVIGPTSTNYVRDKFFVNSTSGYNGTKFLVNGSGVILGTFSGVTLVSGGGHTTIGQSGITTTDAVTVRTNTLSGAVLKAGGGLIVAGPTGRFVAPTLSGSTVTLNSSATGKIIIRGNAGSAICMTENGVMKELVITGGLLRVRNPVGTTCTQ